MERGGRQRDGGRERWRDEKFCSSAVGNFSEHIFKFSHFQILLLSVVK
jgi:hypothetical protein